MPTYFCSLTNTRAGGRFPRLVTDDNATVASFVARWDQPGRALYYCPNPLKPGETHRCVENIAAIVALYVDIDFKTLVPSPDEIDDRLMRLSVEPTAVRNSGNGRHVLWQLKEPALAGTPEFWRCGTLLKRLAACLSADPAPTHAAALLRVVGTHNSKYDPSVLDDLPEDGLFERKAKTNGGGGSAHVHSVNRESKGPVNVGERLANVQYEGPDDSAVHWTELQVTASLLRKGMSVQSTVLTVLEEMRKSMADDPRVTTWDWTEETRLIEEKCYTFVQKNPELSHVLPDGMREPFERLLHEGDRPTIVYSKGPIGWHVRPRSLGRRPGVKNKARSEHTAEHEDAPETEPRKYRFKLVPFADLRPGVEPLYLVDELIPIAGLVDVWGKAKCFKSFWTLDLMLHVALGWEYRDRYVHQGAVVYCAFEGAHGYKKRVEALRRHYVLEDAAQVPLYVMPGQANLIAEHRLLIRDIEEQLGSTKPVAVVLDTLNKSLVGSENKDIDMGAYVRAAEAIRDRFGCVVIIVHHCGYDDTRPRGHSSLPGAVDAQLAVTRQEDVMTVTVEMMRDGPEETQVVSAVETVEVGQDANGKVLTSLAVVPSDANPASAYKDWPRGLAVFHAALKDALAQYGEAFQPEPGAIPVRAVNQWRVRDKFYATYADATADDEEDATKRQNKLRQAFGRAMSDAQGRGLIKLRRTEGEPTMVWFPARDA